MYFRLFKVICFCNLSIAMVLTICAVIWFIFAFTVKDVIQEKIYAEASRGLSFNYQGLRLSGFPFYFNLHFIKPELISSNLIIGNKVFLKNAKFTWRKPSVIVKLKPWNPSVYEVVLSGRSALSYEKKDIVYQIFGKARNLTIVTEISAEGMLEKFLLNGFELQVFSETLDNKIFTIDSTRVRSERLMSSTKRNSIKTVNYSVQTILNGLQSSAFSSLPLGNNIDKIESEFTIFGIQNPELSVRNIQKWRDFGGVIEISSLKFVYDSIHAIANGTLALDKRLQPLLAMSFQLRGVLATLNKLEEGRYIEPAKAIMTKAILSRFSKYNHKGEIVVSLPLTIQDRELTVGPIPFFTFPKIDWGEG